MHPVKRGKPLLGTFVEIGALHAASGTAMAATDAAFSRIARIQQLLSFHDPGSDLSRLNHADGAAVELHPLSVRVIALAKHLTLSSGHAFNCTVGGTMVRKGLLPAHTDRHPAPSGHAGDIRIHGRRVRLENGVSLTLDGIAKGYAVDLAVAALKRHGIKRGWVNAGGDLRVFGDHIAAPDDGFRGEIIGDGVSSAPRVWSVIARHAWLADALTKVAANSPAAGKREMVESLGGHLVFPTA
jgi:thiamine biosynthesis lipoprotein